MAGAIQKQTVQVQHLNTQVGFALANNRLDPSKPTCVLINAFCATADFYADLFASAPLTAAANLLAIEPLGHGSTTALAADHFTFWDSAVVALQALQALRVERLGSRVHVLGVSQGAFVAVRMALLAPETVAGLVLVATSMDSESAESRAKGCWDPAPFVTPFLEKWRSAAPTPNFVPGADWIQPVLGLGFGSAATPAAVDFWAESLRRVYAGDAGRRKLRSATICLAERDGLLLRLGDVTCPVRWLQGTADPVFGSTVQGEHIKLFTASPDAKLELLESDAHFLNVSHPKEIEQALLDMVAKA
ncbi:putative alpha/beta hydrolase [Hypoxylon fuscum]|nr:putative alpha/beta hydrolase [Hypoxylon fuscum]